MGISESAVRGDGAPPSRPAVVPCLAYLAPHLPSFSTTFVYEELLALERRGFRVVPFSIFSTSLLMGGQEALRERTHVLYRNGVGARVADTLAALAALPRVYRGVGRALRWLIADIARVGPLNANSWKLLYHWITGARLGAHLAAAGCTHLHVHFASVPAQIAMYASAFTDIPFTVVGHANDIFERGLLLPIKAVRAKKFLTISNFNLAFLKGVGVAADKLAIVRCGVSFRSLSPIPTFTAKPRYRVGSLGRLIEKKGMDDFLRAVARLRDAPWELEICIAGDGPLRASLQELAQELGIRVRFEGGIEHERVADWLRSLDVFVLACRADANGDMDGIPVVLMEAMSQRVPVITSRLSGIPELVIHERTGLLAPPADPQALAEELRRLLESPELRARLTAAAADHVQVEFGQDVNVDRLLRFVAASPEVLTSP